MNVYVRMHVCKAKIKVRLKLTLFERPGCGDGAPNSEAMLPHSFGLSLGPDKKNHPIT